MLRDRLNLSMAKKPRSCMAAPVRLTNEQRYIFDAACHRLRQDEGAPQMTEGRCLELIAADYLAGVSKDAQQISRSD